MSLFDAMEALRDQLEAQPAIGAGVPIGYPPGGISKPFTVWISLTSDESAQDIQPGVSDLTSFDIEYDIPVRIIAVATTDDLTDAIAVAKPLLAACIAAVKADRTLGGNVGLAWVSRVGADEAAEDTMRGVAATVIVSCREYSAG